MATNGYARISAGVKLKDVNPNRLTTDDFRIEATSAYCGINVCGYKSITFKRTTANTYTYYFLKSDGTSTSPASFTLTANAWLSPITIPDDAITMSIKLTSGSGGSLNFAINA